MEDAHKKALENLRKLVFQYRVGHFQVDCRVLDSSRVMGSDTVEFEVAFKGRFCDVKLPAAPQPKTNAIWSSKTFEILQILICPETGQVRPFTRR